MVIDLRKKTRNYKGRESKFLKKLGENRKLTLGKEVDKRKLGTKLKSGLKTGYKSLTSEKAKANYKKFGKAAGKSVDKLSSWDGDFFGTTKKPRKTTKKSTKRRKGNKPRKVVTEYY